VIRLPSAIAIAELSSQCILFDGILFNPKMNWMISRIDMSSHSDLFNEISSAFIADNGTIGGSFNFQIIM
jgi:hypothetical protein